MLTWECQRLQLFLPEMGLEPTGASPALSHGTGAAGGASPHLSHGTACASAACSVLGPPGSGQSPGLTPEDPARGARLMENETKAALLREALRLTNALQNLASALEGEVLSDESERARAMAAEQRRALTWRWHEQGSFLLDTAGCAARELLHYGYEGIRSCAVWLLGALYVPARSHCCDGDHEHEGASCNMCEEWCCPDCGSHPHLCCCHLVCDDCQQKVCVCEQCPDCKQRLCWCEGGGEEGQLQRRQEALYEVKRAARA